MAFYDDTNWLFGHILNSMTTSDETGMCEQVFVNKDYQALLAEEGDGGQDSVDPFGLLDGDDVPSQSPEITGRTSHRRRSDTAQRLDKLKRDKREAKKVCTVQWREGREASVTDEQDSLFEKQKLPVTTSQEKPTQSKLSSLIALQPPAPPNPFVQYAVFDGSASSPYQNVKRIRIYLNMKGQPKTSFLDIAVCGHATVGDVVGLICWCYTSKLLLPSLQTDVSKYELHIADDDGDVDWELLPLERAARISKFGFRCLALADSRTPTVVQLNVTFVDKDERRVCFSEDATVKYAIHYLKVTKYPELPDDRKYSLLPLDSEIPLRTGATLKTCPHNLRFVPISGPPSPPPPAQKDPSFSPSPEVFRVNYVHNRMFSEAVRLTVGNHTVELSPRNNLPFPWSNKPLTFPIESIQDVVKTNVKKNKVTLQLSRREGRVVKHIDLECEPSVASKLAKCIELSRQKARGH